MQNKPPSGARGPLAKLLSLLRGDRYMVDAYPPAPPQVPGTTSPSAAEPVKNER